MRKWVGLILLVAIIGVSSCDLTNTGLTTDEIIKGLKTALEVGTDSSSTNLSLENGYYGNALLKIPLPDEAQMVQNNINSILALAPSLSSYLNLDQQFENDLVVGSYSSAELREAVMRPPVIRILESREYGHKVRGVAI